MKNPVILLLFIQVFIQFSGCDSPDRSIDRGSSYAFNKGDTLVYHCVTSNDTFHVKNVWDHFIDSDKKQVEVLDISVSEIDIDCMPYCSG
jgi:hypothetical protein